MPTLRDFRNRLVRLTDERIDHIETDHPEMQSQVARISETLDEPDTIIRSRTDSTVELFYKFYESSPITSKFLCVVVKVAPTDNFIITAYYTDRVKRGEILWNRK